MGMPKGRTGNPKGRPVGGKDRRRDQYDVMQKLREHHHDPIVAMIVCAKDETQDPDLRFKCNRELASRIAAPIKSIEIRADSSDLEELQSIKAKFAEFAELYKKSY